MRSVSLLPALLSLIHGALGAQQQPRTSQAPAQSSAQQPGIRSIADATAGMERRDGYFPLYWDAARGRLLLEVPRVGEEFLYLTSLATGVGSLELGLDRGEIGNEYLARFERVGPRVHLVLTNPTFRARSGNAHLVRSVEESFPTSVLASLEILGESEGRVVVDATPFLLTDVMDVIGRLRQGNQGTFRPERERSAIHPPRTRGFPRNTEIEVTLTFSSDNPGPEVRRHTPDGRSLTLREHHSLVRLPDTTGYRPRRFDTRAGFFPLTFWDFAKGFEEDYPERFIIRHRLRKRNPGAAMSEPVEPIVFYLDRAIPEPYRTAFREGGLWWNRVFEAAGFINSFRIEDMPPDMDPMDARYHVIQWVHRTEPGSSIGPSMVDPRTGEIIKAAVRMDSYRSFPDYDIWAGTVPAFGMGDEAADAWLASLDPNVTAEQFTMARRRQHIAHEIGHTLGLAHNFVAAADGRTSVMDYPAPLIRLDGGRLDLSQAYREGPGAWDSLAIRYGYTEFADSAAEVAGLAAILREAERRGLRFITNPDEASASSFPEATTWVNGADMVDELERVMGVRRHLLSRFDDRAVRLGEPLSLLGRRFAMVYLHHRFTLGGAIKAVGGMEFRYAVRGDSAPPVRMVDPERQRRALRLLLDALEPDELRVPERATAVLSPRPFGYAAERRALGSDAGPTFDQLGAARTLAREIVSGLLDPQRMARAAAFRARDGRAPGPDEVISNLVARTWPATGARARAEGTEAAALRRVVQRVVVDELMALAGSERATPEARAAAELALRGLERRLLALPTAPAEEAAHRQLALADIRRFLDRPAEVTRTYRPRPMPSGTPIGGQ
jgi:hypothetical protein